MASQAAVRRAGMAGDADKPQLAPQGGIVEVVYFPKLVPSRPESITGP